MNQPIDSHIQLKQCGKSKKKLQKQLLLRLQQLPSLI
ncbi:hypothetical protein wcw_1662 [Waddlia chondrophila WSU 86-1044]|uniref:Uncharacterized protein n=1 Tax=Waddlia chondrophila (strain ATCC VR-1470 / WSU 86-1044) TaxID=716544 RepID=D6YSG1_WADCW|nr:hypothetical protein wcw_1662 [Waddlia chondrophila WSU 86-1044]